MKKNRKIDLICHECDTELDHSKLKWRQKKSIEYNSEEENKRHVLSIPTCTEKATELLMELEDELIKFKEEIKNGTKPGTYEMLMHVLQDQNKRDSRDFGYVLYLAADFLKLPKGIKRDPEAELPYTTFGSHEFVYVSDCPNCGSLLETPWRGTDSIKASKMDNKRRAKSDIEKCRKCRNSIEFKKQFWYIYFTKHDPDMYDAHIVTICQRCKFEYHHKSGHNLALRFID